jgi:hypothetical protein
MPIPSTIDAALLFPRRRTPQRPALRRRPSMSMATPMETLPRPWLTSRLTCAARLCPRPRQSRHDVPRCRRRRRAAGGVGLPSDSLTGRPRHNQFAVPGLLPPAAHCLSTACSLPAPARAVGAATAALEDLLTSKCLVQPTLPGPAREASGQRRPGSRHSAACSICCHA